MVLHIGQLQYTCFQLGSTAWGSDPNTSMGTRVDEKNWYVAGSESVQDRVGQM